MIHSFIYQIQSIINLTSRKEREKTKYLSRFHVRFKKKHLMRLDVDKELDHAYKNGVEELGIMHRLFHRIHRFC